MSGPVPPDAASVACQPTVSRAAHWGRGRVTALVIPELEEDLLARLAAQAGADGCSVEEEARRLLRQALAPAQVSPPVRFGNAMCALFVPLGGMDLPLVEPR